MMLTKKVISPGGDFSDALDVRIRVFVDEQGFSPESEPDDIDPFATHLVLCEDGIPIATGRTFADADEPSEYHIGRVAILEPYRKSGLGRELMAALEDEATRLGAVSARLGAQCRVEGFYAKFGYEAYGDVYYDEFCPHIYMRKSLR